MARPACDFDVRPRDRLDLVGQAHQPGQSEWIVLAETARLGGIPLRLEAALNCQMQYVYNNDRAAAEAIDDLDVSLIM